EGVVIGVTPFEWDVRVSSKEDPGGHADVYWPGSLHHSTGHYSAALRKEKPMNTNEDTATSRLRDPAGLNKTEPGLYVPRDET
ncbi:hypothetical protein, partial [Microbacterium paraoxydans]|uniref:hypothetical protein n=1 Tax=Microbacterium paraoxydans TaxID=199592 RepID=UPI003013B0D7